MKKTLIASAVALATFASAGVSAQEVNLPRIYGNIQLTTGYSDGDGVENYFGEAGGEYDLFDNGSTLGFLHDHEVMPGLTAFFKAEFHFDPTADVGVDGTDEAYIGLKGNFGQIWAGKDDSIYEWVDVTDLYEALGVPGELEDTGEDRLIQYTTPSFNGLKIGLAYQVNGNKETRTSREEFDVEIDDETYRAIIEDSETVKSRDAFQVAAQYELGSTVIVAAFDSGERAEGNANSYGLAVTHSMGDFNLAAQYEQQEDNLEIVGVLGAYTMGRNVLMGSYHFSKYDASGAEDSHTISLQALHNMSDNFYVYVEGQYIDNAEGVDGGEVKTLLAGATYVF